MIRLVLILFFGCLSAFCGEIECVNGILSVTPFSTVASSCLTQTGPALDGQADYSSSTRQETALTDHIDRNFTTSTESGIVKNAYSVAENVDSVCLENTQAESAITPAKEDTLRVMFWNVENFFREGEFEGHNWSKRRFYSKCAAVAKIILLSGDYFGGLPDIVGFAEIGSIDVLKALIYTTPLRKADYSIVHYDSPDSRGIDCALLYRRTRFRLLSSKPCHLYDNAGHIIPTRDILLAVLEPRNDNTRPLAGKSNNTPLAILVNHHPSKLGKGSRRKRQTAMDRLQFLVDSLKAEGIGQIMAIGDFNEEVESPANLQICNIKEMHAGKIRASQSGKIERLKADKIWKPQTGKTEELKVDRIGESKVSKELQADNERKAWPKNNTSPCNHSFPESHAIAKLYAVPGTIKFQGRWEKIDGCPILEGLEGREYIMALPQLSVKDSYGGVKPRRTFSGPRYLAGVSDHYPVFYLISRAPSLTTTSYTMGSWPNFAANSFFAASINGW